MIHISTDVLVLCVVLVLLSYEIDGQLHYSKWGWSFGVESYGPYNSISIYRWNFMFWRRVKEPEEIPICPCGDDRCQDKALCMLTPA